MGRVSQASKNNVPADQWEAFDEVVRQRGGVPQTGPGSITIHVPEMARRMNRLSEYLREGSTLSSKTQELAMLVTAREMDCKYIWNAHAALGRAAGLRDAVVDGIRDKGGLPTLTADEAAVINYGHEFFSTRQVRKGIFDAAVAQLGIRGLVELTNLMGYYATLAFNINAFDVELPEDRTEPELPVGS